MKPIKPLRFLSDGLNQHIEKDKKKTIPEQLLHAAKNRNFTSVFDVQPSYRAKGSQPALENRNF